MKPRGFAPQHSGKATEGQQVSVAVSGQDGHLMRISDLSDKSSMRMQNSVNIVHIYIYSTIYLSFLGVSHIFGQTQLVKNHPQLFSGLRWSAVKIHRDDMLRGMQNEVLSMAGVPHSIGMIIYPMNVYESYYLMDISGVYHGVYHGIPYFQTRPYGSSSLRTNGRTKLVVL